jgi:taurine dioxygenase
MALAFENLPSELKPKLTQLVAVHDLMPAFGSRMSAEQRAEVRRMYPPMTHPVVRTHPESGEQILYVNEAFTTHLANYADVFETRVGFDFKLAEMDLLQFLLRQAATPEYQMRLQWRPDTLVIWDNRSTQHYAVQDYFPAVRRMVRATVVGEEPR